MHNSLMILMRSSSSFRLASSAAPPPDKATKRLERLEDDDAILSLWKITEWIGWMGLGLVCTCIMPPFLN